MKGFQANSSWKSSGRAGAARTGISDDEILPEHSLERAIPNRYADRYGRDAIVALLDPDVSEVFPDDESVNRALRALAQIIRERASKTAA